MRSGSLALTFLVAGCGYLGLDSIDEEGEFSDLGLGGSVEVEAMGGTLSNGETGGNSGSGTGGKDLGLGGLGSGGLGSGGGTVGTGGVSGCVEPCDRVQDGLILLYDFEEGSGAIVHDTSPRLPHVNLSLPPSDAFSWVSGGLSLKSSKPIVSDVPVSKLKTAVQLSNEISFEAWVEPGEPTQGGPARFFTVSFDENRRNFLLGQDEGAFVARLRTSETDDNGQGTLKTSGLVTKALTHVAYTREVGGSERLFVNGVVAAEGTRPGSLSNWDESYHLALGGEQNVAENERVWHGAVHLVAIYDRALSAEEVAVNFKAAH